MLKFRTTSVSQANDDETRVTHVGRDLRRFGIDALPQLFNVLKGDMALVGPLPQPVTGDEKK